MNDIIYAGRHPITQRVSKHTHIGWEFIYFLSGSGIICFDKTKLCYKSGDIAVIPPSLIHSTESLDGFTNYHVNIANCSLDGTSPRLLSCEENKYMLPVFEAAFAFFQDDSKEYLPLLACYGKLLATYAKTIHPENSRNKISEEIEQNIISRYNDSDYDLTAFLKELPFNYDYVIKLFKNDTGSTPHKYLTELRLKAACEMLSDNAQTSISQISQTCGFKNPLYFSRLFRKYIGMSPSEYAKSESNVERLNSSNVKITD